ncbi:S-adenosyl-L-methionine-dependent methyltransferase [Paractinoplanes deccanensis]|uniref:S-adenosyl-L-methionine-dependent methyltransferase n=1 Tax=Paractinoplanes deccanensis TaxID=113561 RepID=A0ABQ3XYL3_9ACTN|nr:SAM-dependent methyltransferase [Actinoplanes deccanensis]GID72820.1 S-adenosyl-L-methionine-dependent methyltransferase [Actinoplanes deccanensis]
MQNSASATALSAAAARAAHLLVDAEPHIFADTLAAPLLGSRSAELIDHHRRHGAHPVLAGARTQATIRSRLTETLLTGFGQYVILGAGLDSFAYRSPLAAGIHVFEVDHPATQADKRERLATAGLSPLGPLIHVPVDLEKESFLPALLAAGLDPARPALVSWLGVTMYLTPDATAPTVAALATLAPGSRLVLDYLLPPALRDQPGQAYADAVASFSAAQGEPWLSYFTPAEMTALLATHGFHDIHHLDQTQALPPQLWRRGDALHPSRLSMLAHAKR